MEDRSIEVSAADVEEAIRRGLARLGLAREQVQIEVVQQESRGLFGIGAREAIVRMSPKGQVDNPQVDAPVAAPAVAPVAVPAVAPPPISSADTVPPTRPERSVVPPQRPTAPQEAKDEYTLAQDEIPEIARQTLSELLDKMGIECRVVIRQEEPVDDEPAVVALDVLGDDVEALIGRQGEVLNALQYITRQIVSREVEQWVNLVVDVQRYKQRRARSLRQLAESIAERVARTKQPVALEPMPPNERRVIHLALHDHPAVTTQSVGKGESRKVTIIPRR
jgi:spoIIIJ-associated protein